VSCFTSHLEHPVSVILVVFGLLHLYPFFNYGFEYHSERVTHGTNMNTCTANGGQVCDPNTISADNPLVNIRPVYNYPYPLQNTFFWTDASCTQMVKVRQDGMMCVMCMRNSDCLFFVHIFAFADVSLIIFVASRVLSELSAISLQQIQQCTRKGEQ
jgi:hypothetical protein